MEDLKKPLSIVILVFLGLFVYTKIAGPIPFSVNSITTTKTDVFTVSGTGKVTVVPDTARVSLGITVNRPRVVDAQNEANRVIGQITKDLKSLGIDEKKIKTTNYSVNPNYDYREGGQRIRDYNVNATLEVEIAPIDKVNDAIDRSTAAGANTVGGIQFTVDEKRQKELEREAREQAIDEAKKKAGALASDAGMRLGKIINVIEGPSYQPPIVYDRGLSIAMEEKQVPTEVQPGETAINITVSLTYEVL